MYLLPFSTVLLARSCFAYMSDWSSTFCTCASVQNDLRRRSRFRGSGPVLILGPGFSAALNASRLGTLSPSAENSLSLRYLVISGAVKSCAYSASGSSSEDDMASSSDSTKSSTSVTPISSTDSTTWSRSVPPISSTTSSSVSSSGHAVPPPPFLVGVDLPPVRRLRTGFWTTRSSSSSALEDSSLPTVA